MDAGSHGSRNMKDVVRELTVCLAALFAAAERLRRSPNGHKYKLAQINESIRSTMNRIVVAMPGCAGKDAKDKLPVLLSRRMLIAPADGGVRMSFANYIEFSSIREYRKFQVLPPITSRDLKMCEMDSLLMRLYKETRAA